MAISIFTSHCFWHSPRGMPLPYVYVFCYMFQLFSFSFDLDIQGILPLSVVILTWLFHKIKQVCIWKWNPFKPLFWQKVVSLLSCHSDEISWESSQCFCPSISGSSWWSGWASQRASNVKYHQISNMRYTKSPNLNVSHLVLQLSLCNILKSGVKSRMKM